MSTTIITPTGGADDYSKIQNTVNGLNTGDTIQLNGDFISKNTVQLKSSMIWRLNGSLKLANGTNKWLVTDKSGGISNLEMIGGTYDGNGINQTRSSTTNHCIRFSKVTNSHFKDMIVKQANNDNFTLDTDCHNNLCENIIGRSAVGGGVNKDGNGLAYKGGQNTWIDCIAEDNSSDNWVMKCNNSIFRRCIGRGSKLAVGFGFFTDANHPTGNGNRFENCSAYNNAHSGFSFSNNLSNGQTNNNFISGEFYNNGTSFDTTGHGSGIRINNKGNTITGNEFDVYCHDNPEYGILYQSSGINNNRGSIVAINNKSSDIDISKGSGNSFDVYIPSGKITEYKARN